MVDLDLRDGRALAAWVRLILGSPAEEYHLDVLSSDARCVLICDENTYRRSQLLVLSMISTALLYSGSEIAWTDNERPGLSLLCSLLFEAIATHPELGVRCMSPDRIDFANGSCIYYFRPPLIGCRPDLLIVEYADLVYSHLLFRHVLAGRAGRVIVASEPMYTLKETDFKQLCLDRDNWYIPYFPYFECAFCNGREIRCPALKPKERSF